MQKSKRLQDSRVLVGEETFGKIQRQSEGAHHSIGESLAVCEKIASDLSVVKAGPKLRLTIYFGYVPHCERLFLVRRLTWIQSLLAHAVVSEVQFLVEQESIFGLGIHPEKAMRRRHHRLNGLRGDSTVGYIHESDFLGASIDLLCQSFAFLDGVAQHSTEIDKRDTRTHEQYLA